MMTASRTENEHPVISALDELIASYDRAVAAFEQAGLGSEAEALLPDRELLVVLRGRLDWLGDSGRPAGEPPSGL
jgi:hypothetical protein